MARNYYGSQDAYNFVKVRTQGFLGEGELRLRYCTLRSTEIQGTLR